MTAFKLGLKIGLVLALISAAGILFWQNKGLVERGARQAATILQQKTEIADKDRRIEDLARQREAAEAVAAREKARSIEIYSRVKDLRDEILRMERDMEDVMAWADDVMPDELDSMLMGPTSDSSD